MGLGHIPDNPGLHNKVKVDGSTCCTTISLEYDKYMGPVGRQQELQLITSNMLSVYYISYVVNWKYINSLSLPLVWAIRQKHNHVDNTKVQV